MSDIVVCNAERTLRIRSAINNLAKGDRVYVTRTGSAYFGELAIVTSVRRTKHTRKVGFRLMTGGSASFEHDLANAARPEGYIVPAHLVTAEEAERFAKVQLQSRREEAKAAAKRKAEDDYDRSVRLQYRELVNAGPRMVGDLIVGTSESGLPFARQQTVTTLLTGNRGALDWRERVDYFGAYVGNTHDPVIGEDGETSYADRLKVKAELRTGMSAEEARAFAKALLATADALDALRAKHEGKSDEDIIRAEREAARQALTTTTTEE